MKVMIFVLVFVLGFLIGRDINSIKPGGFIVDGTGGYGNEPTNSQVGGSKAAPVSRGKQ